MSTPKHFLTLSDLTSDELRGIISRAQALKALQREGIPHPRYPGKVLAMLFVGAMIPFFFSSLAISAVGKAAMDMVKEVRRQFREIPGIMEGTAKPEYEKCVEISTKASIRQMIAPGALALLSPVFVGFAFGPEALGGLLAGITVSGVLMGMFQNNAGGAWDNAKKSFEK